MAEGIDHLESGNSRSRLNASVKHIKVFLPGNATDEEIIEVAGKQDGIIITYDLGFKKLKARKRLYKQFGIGVIVFHTLRDVVHYWDVVRSFVNRWEELKEEIHVKKKPFLMEISLKGFVDVALDE